MVRGEEEPPIFAVVGEALGELRDWAIREPAAAVLSATIIATLVYFFQVLHPFYSGTRSVVVWARSAWNPEGDQSYGAFVPLIAIGFFIYHWNDLRRSPKQGDDRGLIGVGLGILLFVLSVRCLQPRIALFATPFLLYGGILYLWGPATARVVLFPCAFLVFMIPVGGITQATASLQLFVTDGVRILSKLIGVGIQAVGTSLTATDKTFSFEIAEGCSGIRSLMAMVMVTAAYVHLTQDRLWKKVTIFSASILFAISGNLGRVFSVVVVAKFVNKDFAGGIYHDYSGWIFFAVAISAMLGCDRLVNLDWASFWRKIQESAKVCEEEVPRVGAPVESGTLPKKTEASDPYLAPDEPAPPKPAGDSEAAPGSEPHVKRYEY